MDPVPGSGRPLAIYAATITFVPNTALRPASVNLNTAALRELVRLPGVGPAVAKRIVRAREERPFSHPAEVVSRKLVPRRFLSHLLELTGASETPQITGITTKPEHVMYERPFEIAISFNDSPAGVRLVRLQADSISHAIDIAREVDDEARGQGRVVFELPAMSDGPMNVQATLFDARGEKAYSAQTIQIFHNPPSVNVFPAERTARLSNGAALFKSDGNFHCDSNWSIVNGVNRATTLGRVLSWKILDQGGGTLHAGTWDYGADIQLAPFEVSAGWWFTFAMPPGSAAFNRLNSKQQIRIEWTFRELSTGASIVFGLTWRALVAVNVNIIRVGEENFTADERNRTFNALRQTASSIYQAQDFDVGTISTFIVPLAQANGHETIDNDGEAENLTGDWTVPNQAIDMFVVRNYVGPVGGLSPVGGPCDKDAKGMTGSVIELQSSQLMTGIVMAHELGHYLGLDHVNLLNNLMNPTAGTSNTVLTNGQGSTMKNFGCFLRFI